MITNDGDPLFPMNVVSLVSTRLSLIDTDVQVFQRRLVGSDPVQCIGVSAATWSPVPRSEEMGGGLAWMPTLERYVINVQTLIKHTDQQVGIAIHSKLSKMVRNILLTDSALLQTLPTLTSTLYGVTERFTRMTVPLQRYLSQELSGNLIFLSTVECQVETENTNG